MFAEVFALEEPDQPLGRVLESLHHRLAVLELAATYDAFRESGSDHEEAIKRLRRKKGSECDEANQKKAMESLNALGLDAE